MIPSGVFYTADNGSGGTALFYSDGTSSLPYSQFETLFGGTVQLATLPTGGAIRLQALGNGLVAFQASMNGITSIWASDGTAAGTRSLAPGTNLEVIRPGVAAFTSDGFLYITDGISVSRPAVTGVTPRSPGLGFDSVSVAGPLIDQGDGSAAFVLNRQGSPPFYSFGAVANTAAYAPAAAPGGYGAWFTAPTNGNQFLVTPARFEALPSGLSAAGTPFFSQWQGSVTYSGVYGQFARLDGDRAVLNFQPGVSGDNREPYVASLSGISLLREINPFGSSLSQGFANVGQGRVAFSATDGGATGQEPWITDGTPAGTFPLGDLKPGPLAGGGNGFTPLSGGRFVFSADDGVTGSELWVSDGTAAGTRLVADLNPGASGSFPDQFTSLADGRAAFIASASIGGGRLLFVTDGTAAGTVTINNPGAANLTATTHSFYSQTGTPGIDYMPGSLANDSRRGGEGDDELLWSRGDDTLDGGAGRDTADYSAQVWRGWTTAYKPVDGLTLSRPGERDLLIGMESARFSDGRLVFDAQDPVAQMYRLYQAAFGRAPDEAGFNVNITALAATTQAIMASAFVASAEFSLIRGGALDNAGFVQSLYRSAFNRNGEAAGVNFWTGFLNGGGSRGDMLLAFSESLEMRNATATRLSTGIWDVDEGAAQIARLYLAGLDRAPDEAGFLAAVAARGFGLNALATGMLGSVEFGLQPVPSDGAFVTRIFNQALNRAPDANGLAHFTGLLAAGASRADVLIWISESPEHQAISQPFVMPADAHGIVFA